MSNTTRIIIRSDYPLLGRFTYLDTASCGALALSTVAAAQAEQERILLEGPVRRQCWVDERMPLVRERVAATIGGDPAGTILTQGFSVGLAQLVPLLTERKKVLLVRGDYPTLHAPFLHGDHHVLWYDPSGDGAIEQDVLAAMIDKERPQLVAISHVQWSTGYRIDLRSLGKVCTGSGAWLLVDATQSWCSVPFDLAEANVDILGASGYKWALAGFGNGFLHLSAKVRAEMLARSGTDPVAALSMGHLDPVAFERLHEALGRVIAHGPQVIADQVNVLYEHALEVLRAEGIRVLNGAVAAQRGGILIIEGDEALAARLVARGVQCAFRGRGIRIGLHAYNAVEDIDTLVAALRH